MAIKRYVATADNTISNAYKENLRTRATGSNMGQADVSEVFSIYARQSTSSAELSRVLTQFRVSDISSDRTAGIIPASGSVNFYLRLFNAETSKTVPKNFTIVAQAISRSWSEGDGLDLENYKDIGASNWISASQGTPWTSQGGDYHVSPRYTQAFETGLEDIQIDISELVEQWIAGTKDNYGVGIRLTSSLEDSTTSYYTKRFFARGTQYFFKKPVIEARWNSSNQDDRGDFYYSSSLAPPSDNLNTIYLYNYSRGRLRNIPSVGIGEIYVNLYETLGGSPLTLAIDTPATGGYVSAGIYSCSLGVETTASTLFDVWSKDGVEFYTGSISVQQNLSEGYTEDANYVLSMPGLKREYQHEQTHKLRLYARERDWSPNIFTVANTIPSSLVFESASYQIFRAIDGATVVPYGTGSSQHTRLSYDVSGNYFYLDTSILEPNYTYGIRFSIYNLDSDSYEEQPYTFKIRVVENEY